MMLYAGKLTQNNAYICRMALSLIAHPLLPQTGAGMVTTKNPPRRFRVFNSLTSNYRPGSATLRTCGASFFSGRANCPHLTTNTLDCRGKTDPAALPWICRQRPNGTELRPHTVAEFRPCSLEVWCTAATRGIPHQPELLHAALMIIPYILICCDDLLE